MPADNRRTLGARRFALMGAVLAFACGSAALACSTAVLGLPDRPIVAYSFDFAPTGGGFFYANPASAARRSIMQDGESEPAEWFVEYASVTFSQMGPGMPVAGMNTAGLVVTLMWNEQVVFGGRKDAPIVNELELIQRLLDTSGTVDEALESLDGVRIQGLVPIHYLLADRTGNTAAVMPTEAGYRIHSGDDMPLPALTNTSYADLLAHVSAYDGFGGAQAVPAGGRSDEPSSLERFVLAANAVRRVGSTAKQHHAFNLLNQVANGESRWQIAFDPSLGQIAFRIVGANKVFAVDLSAIDFQCRELPLSAELSGASAIDVVADLAPVDPAQISDVSREVLAALSQGGGIGPEIADELTAGLLQSAVCLG
ncbi:MAG: carcinine hydrolase/isopenicillin-N N-acyltransferase family protein [Pseudomonadota bacterium]